MTQPDFAALVGISNSMLQKLEHGTEKMPKLVAYRIRAQTGCAITLTESESGTETYSVSDRLPSRLSDPNSLDLATATRPYERRDYEAHRQNRISTAEEETAQRAAMHSALDRVLNALEHADVRPAIVIDYEDFIRAAVIRYDLHEALVSTFSEDRATAEQAARLFTVEPLHGSLGIQDPK